MSQVVDGARCVGIKTPPTRGPKHRKTGPTRAAKVHRPTPARPVLPTPPAHREKCVYVKRRAWLLTICPLLSFPLLVYSQIRMMDNYHLFWLYVPFVSLSVLCFILPLLTDRLGRGFDLAEHQRLVAEWQPWIYPSVDIFLPVCGEPTALIQNTWMYVARMCRHYRGQTRVYVLDDAANVRLKEMAQEFGFGYAVRPGRGWLKKSGNLHYGFQISKGEFILLLDADFAPRGDLLDETLPYMDAFPDCAIVQTPQFFRISDEQSWVERGAGASQELFYRSIQTVRSRKGATICCGSCAVYRRAALETNGGMSLAEHSEDLRTGFDLRRRGWQVPYIPIALSTGSCPDNVVAFMNQQYRWCCGTLSLLCDKEFWHVRMSSHERMCWLSGFIYYIYSSAYVFVVPAMAIAMLLLVPGRIHAKDQVYLLPALVYIGVIYPAWHRAPYRLEAWSIRVVMGWAHLFAFWDMARGRLRTWQPTGMRGHRGKWRFWLGVISWSGTTSVLWTSIALWRMVTMNPYNFFLLFIIGVFNLIVVGRVLIQPQAGAAR